MADIDIDAPELAGIIDTVMKTMLASQHSQVALDAATTAEERATLVREHRSNLEAVRKSLDAFRDCLRTQSSVPKEFMDQLEKNLAAHERNHVQARVDLDALERAYARSSGPIGRS